MRHFYAQLTENKQVMRKCLGQHSECKKLKCHVSKVETVNKCVKIADWHFKLFNKAIKLGTPPNKNKLS